MILNSLKFQSVSLSTICIGITLLFNHSAIAASPLTCASGNEAKCLGMTMSYVADQANGKDMIIGEGVTQQAIVSAAKKRMQCILPKAASGPWSLVWGPAVKFELDKAINTTMVARQGKSSNYYIGIAGTDFDSLYDWITEDFEIAPTTDGGFGDMTTGTHNGLETVLGQAAPDGTSLTSFLQSATTGISSTQPAPVFSVAGHSLGGALAPAFGLWMKNNQAQWDKSDGMRAEVNVYAFAGATPGGPKMQAQMGKQFTQDGSAADGGNLVIVNNSKDVVPHGWNVSDPRDPLNMYNLPGLYGIPYLETPPGADSKILALIFTATGVSTYERNKAHDQPEFSDFSYLTMGSASQQQPLSGTVYQSKPATLKWMANVCPSFTPPATLTYLEEALFQHVCAYDVLLGMKGTLNTASHQCGQANLPTQN